MDQASLMSGVGGLGTHQFHPSGQVLLAQHQPVGSMSDTHM